MSSFGTMDKARVLQLLSKHSATELTPQTLIKIIFLKEGTPICCWWKCKIVQPLWRFLRRPENRRTIWPRYTHSGSYPKDSRPTYHKDIIHWCTVYPGSGTSLDIHGEVRVHRGILWSHEEKQTHETEKMGQLKVITLKEISWPQRVPHIFCLI